MKGGAFGEVYSPIHEPMDVRNEPCQYAICHNGSLQDFITTRLRRVSGKAVKEIRGKSSPGGNH